MNSIRRTPTDFGLRDGHGNGPPASAAPVRVWLVDDNDAFRGVLARELSRRAGLDCPRHFPCPQSALQALQVEAPPDVVVLDVHLRGTNGVDAIAPLKAAAPGTRVLMLTTFFDHHTEAAARKAGAVGFLLKSYSCQQIAESIRLAGSGPLDAPVAAVGTEALPRKRPEFVPLVERGARLFRAWLRERNRRAAAAGLN